MKPIFKVLIITVICIFLWIIVSNFKFDVPEKVVHSNNKTSVNNDENKSKEVIEADDSKISDIDHYLKNSNFNGNITIYKNKKLVMNKGYGYRDFSREIKNDSNSMYLIGSANKFLTGLILIQLEDEKN